MICCWSAKGGAGTTVVAAALALRLARGTPGGALLVDLGGDAASVLGLPAGTHCDAGQRRWQHEGEVAGAVTEMGAGAGLSVLALGAARFSEGDGIALLERLELDSRPVVVDAGLLGCAHDCSGAGRVAGEVAAAATHSLLVLRPCFLAVRRALMAPIRPSGIVLVEEEGRALTVADVEAALDVPVRARVRVTPQVARAVDAGLLAVRLPPSLDRDLRHAA